MLPKKRNINSYQNPSSEEPVPKFLDIQITRFQNQEIDRNREGVKTLVSNRTREVAIIKEIEK